MGFKDGEDNFDVPMGCYNRAEVCQLVGTNLLNQLKVAIAKENMRPYRDDSLGMFKNMSWPEVKKKEKITCEIFENKGLSITVKLNLKTADFLDIHFDIVKEIYHYINKKSNHAQPILQQLSKSISKRISEIS